MRAQVAFAFRSGNVIDVPGRLLKVARRLESFDLELARETYLIAWHASIYAGHLAEANALPEVCRAVRSLPPLSGAPRPLDLLLDGLALLTTGGRAAAAPILQRAAKALAGIPVGDVLRWGWAATGAAAAVWDDAGMIAMYARHVRLTRDAGALSELPIHLDALALASAWSGDFSGSAALIVEAESVAAATGSRFTPTALLRLRTLQGREGEAAALIAATIKGAEESGQGIAVTVALWAAAVLYNGLARYEEAASAAGQAATNTFEPWVSMWVLPELVEAAAHADDAEHAREALERLAETTQPCGTDFALGIEARCRALVGDGTTADDLYREAIDRLSRTRLRPELARAHLLYGEWLRRGGRRVDARKQLRTAHEMFATIGMGAFAERTRRELIATGEKLRRLSDETRDELTPQEEQIARLARDGRTNREIGAVLFLSPRTVEWHLRKTFAKLGISSRNALHTALPREREATLA